MNDHIACILQNLAVQQFKFRDFSLKHTNKNMLSPNIDLTAIARVLLQAFDHWGVSKVDQLALLGLNPRNQSTLKRMRDGGGISTRRDALERSAHLLAIHKQLRTLFPHNRDVAYGWMTIPNKAFNGISPINLIRDFGFTGLLMVRGYLDKTAGN